MPAVIMVLGTRATPMRSCDSAAVQSLPSCKIIQARSQGTFLSRGKILTKGTQGFFSGAAPPSDARGAPIRPCLPRVGYGRRPRFRIFFAFQDPILG